jgi:superoxide dismutase, Cu-Zn family
MSALVTTVLAAAIAAAPVAGPHTQGVSVEQTFGTSPKTAITYNQTLVPKGSHVTVKETLTGRHSTRIDLRIRGLKPNRHYGAHVHTMACGTTGEAAGPHYQNKKDPVTPSVNPVYANPRNEVWLDFMTDAKGAANSHSTVNWRFRTGGAKSVIIHDHMTATGTGVAGTAGDRLACVNVPFK